MVLHAYLDSSGNLAASYLTLAAFVGPDDIWCHFDTEWAKILGGHTPPASYVHMRELAHIRPSFQISDVRAAFGQEEIWNVLLRG